MSIMVCGMIWPYPTTTIRLGFIVAHSRYVFRTADALGLHHREAQPVRGYFHRRFCKLISAAFGTVGLSKHGRTS